MPPSKVSKGDDLSVCPKLNSWLATQTQFFLMRPMTDGPTLGIYLMEIDSAFFFVRA